jgi:hypothetical protein
MRTSVTFPVYFVRMHWTSHLLLLNSICLFGTGYYYYVLGRPIDGFGYLHYAMVNFIALGFRQIEDLKAEDIYDNKGITPYVEYMLAANQETHEDEDEEEAEAEDEDEDEEESETLVAEEDEDEDEDEEVPPGAAEEAEVVAEQEQPQEQEEAVEEEAVEEEPVKEEAPVEEAPVEEPVKEEAPVEEAPVEEPVKEEAPEVADGTTQTQSQVEEEEDHQDFKPMPAAQPLATEEVPHRGRGRPRRPRLPPPPSMPPPPLPPPPPMAPPPPPKA